MSNEDIVLELEKMDKESKSLKDDLVKIAWWMRGSISYDQAFNLTRTDRESVNALIKENLEASKKSGTPIF